MNLMPSHNRPLYFVLTSVDVTSSESLSNLTYLASYIDIDLFLFFLMLRPPPRSPLFPSTPLSRSHPRRRLLGGRDGGEQGPRRHRRPAPADHRRQAIEEVAGRDRGALPGHERLPAGLGEGERAQIGRAHV